MTYTYDGVVFTDKPKEKLFRFLKKIIAMLEEKNYVNIIFFDVSVADEFSAV